MLGRNDFYKCMVQKRAYRGESRSEFNRTMVRLISFKTLDLTQDQMDRIQKNPDTIKLAKYGQWVDQRNDIRDIDFEWIKIDDIDRVYPLLWIREDFVKYHGHIETNLNSYEEFVEWARNGAYDDYVKNFYKEAAKNNTPIRKVYLEYDEVKRLLGKL